LVFGVEAQAQKQKQKEKVRQRVSMMSRCMESVR